MKLPSSIEVRRARPLLGTIVEITVRGNNSVHLEEAIDVAFTTVAHVHRLMSFHDPLSDVSWINCHAFYKSARVHPLTWHVLKCAQEFSRESSGVFDITTARQLVKWNYLPPLEAPLDNGSWRDIVLEDACHVRFRRPVIIDLGGIAKGFAVDRAVEALKHNGVKAGIVNAGGDLRTFGSSPQLIHLRHPGHPTRVAGAVRLRERAMATSGIYFRRRKYSGRYVSPLLHGRTRQSAREQISVTVGAANCMTADALTKVVFALREEAAPLLARYSADAVLLEQDGDPSWMFHPTCDASHQA